MYKKQQGVLVMGILSGNPQNQVTPYRAGLGTWSHLFTDKGLIAALSDRS